MILVGMAGILRLPRAISAGAVDAVMKNSTAVKTMAKILTAVAVIAAPILAAPVTVASSEYDAAIVSALALPVRDALRTFDSLSREQSLPGWVRAKSLKLLGDHQFIKADYKKAADFYLQASKFDNSSAYRLQYALALAADGRTDAAKDILSAVAGDGADIMSDEAASMLQEIAPGSQQAVPVQQVASSNSTNNAVINNAPQSTPNAAPSVTVNTEKTPTPASQQATNNNAINNNVANNAQQSTSNATPNVAVNTEKTPTPNNQQTVFTVQVGAFGAVENADNLYRKLSSTYKDITVSPTTAGGQTLYRVRIGTFQNREDAAAFADQLLTTAGLSARVVEK